MRDDDDGAEATAVAAFVIGAMAGAAVAMLVAPASGSEMRALLGEKSKDGRERINETARQGRQLLTRQFATVSSAVGRGREAYQQARSGATLSAGPGARQ